MSVVVPRASEQDGSAVSSDPQHVACPHPAPTSCPPSGSDPLDARIASNASDGKVSDRSAESAAQRRQQSLNMLGLNPAAPPSFVPSSSPRSAADDWVAHALHSNFNPYLLRRQSPMHERQPIRDVGSTIYDNERNLDFRRSDTKGSGIITIDDRDGDGELVADPRVWRCFMDTRVIAADVAMLISVFGTCVVSPLCFIWGGSWHDHSPLPFGVSILILDVAFDVIYAAHLAMRLRTSFLHDARRNEIVNLDTILKHHLLDPVYWILCIGSTAHFWAVAFDAPLIIVNNVKIARPIKQFFCLPDSLWRVRDTTIVRLAIPIMNLLLFSHWVACMLSHVGGFREKAIVEGLAANYSSTFDGKQVSEWPSLYLMCLVESIYMFTGALDNPLGDGSIRERQFGALLLIAIGGPLGCLFVSYFISALVREQALNYALDMRHEENKAFMLRALRNLDIPEHLQTRVLGLHEFQKMGHDCHALDALFNKKNLSPPLELALRVYLYHDSVLAKSPYLIGKDTNYVLEVISILEDQIYLPGDFVTRRGQVGSCMFFVLRGELSVLVPDRSSSERSIMHTEEVTVKRRGDYFGEIALIKDSVRTAWVRANTYVLLAVLTREHAEAIWKHYPQEREKLAAEVIHTARLELARQNTAATSQSVHSAPSVDTEAPLQQAADAVRLQWQRQSLPRAHRGDSKVQLEPSVGTTLNPASAALAEAASGCVSKDGVNAMCATTMQSTISGLRELRDLLEEHVKENRVVAFEHGKQLLQISERQVALEKRFDSLEYCVSDFIAVSKTRSRTMSANVPYKEARRQAMIPVVEDVKTQHAEQNVSSTLAKSGGAYSSAASANTANAGNDSQAAQAASATIHIDLE